MKGSVRLAESKSMLTHMPESLTTALSAWSWLGLWLGLGLGLGLGLTLTLTLILALALALALALTLTGHRAWRLHHLAARSLGRTRQVR